MGGVIIYSDLQKTFDDSYDLLVEKTEEYVDAYSVILEAIYKDIPLIVVIRNKYCMNYFARMQERYKDKITIKVNSPKERLAEAVGLIIPDYITDEDIVKDKLNTTYREILFNSAMSFEDNILNHYLGIYFASKRFPFGQIVSFLKSLNHCAITNLSEKVILKKVYERRVKIWLDNCSESYEKRIIDEFIVNSVELLNKVSKYLILKHYSKEVLKDVIGEFAFDLEKLRLKDDAFIAKDMDIIDVQRNIRLYLNRRNINNLTKEDVINEINHLSGLFFDELQYVYNMLRENQSILDFNILRIVKHKFKVGNQLDIQFEEKLNSLIPPKIVESPENINTIEDWISWAKDSYLPYKYWMESNDVFDNKVDEYSQMYGDWAYSNYSSLVSSCDKMIYKALTNLGSQIKHDELSFIVIIDNFNYKYVSLCKSYMNKKGYSSTLDQPMISMIPTETFVSKTAFFSGQPFNTENKSYDTLCKEWEKFFEGKVTYLSDIGKLDEVNENSSKLYILNYLSIDKILHDSQNNAALPISHRIQEELKAMMDKVISFSKRLGYENTIKIYFTSDHGSTKILKEQTNLIDVKYYKAKSDDCAYRVLALQDKKFATYKSGVGHLCYVLDRNAYGIKENYLIAKGYSRFMETDLSFYVHGGITPEENIVPLLKFERVDAGLISPEIILRNNEFRYSILSSVRLSIKNHNEYAIENIEITIDNPNIRWDQGTYLLSSVSKESQVDIVLDKVRILKGQVESNKLTLKMKYNFLGKEYEQSYSFDIKVKSTQESTFDFNDL